jgi:hypothetical protein
MRAAHIAGMFEHLECGGCMNRMVRRGGSFVHNWSSSSDGVQAEPNASLALAKSLNS